MTLPITDLTIGCSVTYTPAYGPAERGIVKELRAPDVCFVVYNCADDWDNFADYTAARTELADLTLGWR